MNKGKKLGRGLEDISYLFLSSSQREQSNKTACELAHPTCLPSETPTVLGVFCCLPIQSFFSCNLSLEIAKRNQTISVIDFGLRQPNVRHLMGNLVDLQDDFPTENIHNLEFKIESIKLYGFSKVTIISLSVPREQIALKRIMEKIFIDKRIRESDIILINLPNGMDNTILSEPFYHFQKTLFIMDSQIRSLLEAYSWIKKLSPLCQKYLIGTIVQEEEDGFLCRQNIKKLQKTVKKYLSVDFDILTTVDISIDQEARNSMKLRRPLALMESTSASGKAIADLCENLLGKQ